jgi:hypothetical protein
MERVIKCFTLGGMVKVGITWKKPMLAVIFGTYELPQIHYS